MANEEVLGPRKTMFVLVIVVGCFAVLWPRILSPLMLGSRDSVQPNRFDREAGCCEVIFASEVAMLEILNEVCNAAAHTEGRLSPYAAAECRKSVNETCGVDIAAFLKRSENVGKTTKMLLDTMKASNSSCLKEHFGLPEFSLSSHTAYNSWTLQDTVKQERSPIRGGPHPALRERGRAIPPRAATPTPERPAPLPSHIRVRSSPLSVYYELDIKPPPIPGMRPPLGGAGGPVQAPKSSMGFVMPIYTICIIVFFVYTLSKILFKRTGCVPYEQVQPDPQFRRRVFRDDSRSSPDKLGPRERDTNGLEWVDGSDEEFDINHARQVLRRTRPCDVTCGNMLKNRIPIVTAISGLVAEVQQQMEASYAQNQQRQEQENHARPYTNGTIIHSGPVQIVASEYQEPSREKTPEAQKEPSLEPKKPTKPESTPEPKELTPEPKEATPEPKETTPEPKEVTPEPKETTPEPKETTPEPKVATPPLKEPTPEPKDLTPESKEPTPEEESPEKLSPERDPTEELIRLTEKVEEKTDSLAKLTDEFLSVEKNRVLVTPEKQSTPELLEEALKEDSPAQEEDEEEIEEEEEEEEEEEPEKSTVKVVGMELTAHAADGGAWRPRGAPPPRAPAPRAHEADEVKSIYLETEIPQQSRVLVADFADHADKPPHTKNSPMVVSGKMTLSLIQDAPRDTPERDLESTVDDFTTASGVTQPAAEKEDDLSEEEVEEEIEVEEIEEEVEESEEEEEEEPKKAEK